MTQEFVTECDGVIVPQPEPATHQLYHDWNIKRQWCDSNGWKMGVDYVVTANLNNTKWYFRTKKLQTFFVLRWG